MKTSLLAIALTAFSAPQGPPAQQAPRTPVWKAELARPAPLFELPDTHGRTWELARLRGKTVVLEWFNPDCPVVRGAHGPGGALETLGNRIDSRDDTVWLAINSGAPGEQGNGREKNEKARERWSLEYPVLLDESGWVGAAYGAKTTPHLFVIDAKGELVFAGHHEDVAAALEDLEAGLPIHRPLTKSHGCAVKYPRKAEVGLLAPDFAAKALNGEDVRLSELRGRVVVLEWFNPDCPFVRQAHGPGGALEDAALRWTAEGVRWIAINSGAPGKQGTGAERNRNALAAWHLEHPLVLDESGRIGHAYGATSTPHLFVIDPRGVLVYAGAHADRATGEPYLDEALSEVTSGKPVAKPRTRNYGCSVKYGS